MGNRAVLTFSNTPSAPCIYLHWNGGRASVEGFMGAARALGYHERGYSAPQLIDALAELIATHFFGVEVNKVHVYVERFGEADTDNWDNGTYILNEKDLQVIGRMFFKGQEEWDQDKTTQIMHHIVGSVGASVSPSVAIC